MDARVRLYKGDAVIWEKQGQEALAKESAEAHAPGRVRDGDKFTFEFTGKHDHGDLEPREDAGGGLDKLSQFLSIVKEESRQVLAGETNQSSNAGNVSKKQKTED